MAGKDKAAPVPVARAVRRPASTPRACVPEISDDVVSIDRAMEWGYGWGLGPFRLLDALGVAAVAERATARGPRGPAAGRGAPGLRAASASTRREGATTMFGPSGVAPVPARPGVIDLAALKARGGVRKKNAGASLVDLGDGCGLVEFHTKMNALGADTFAHAAGGGQGGPRRTSTRSWSATRASNFTVGANLMLVLLAAQEEEWDELDLSIRQFQNANMALKYARPAGGGGALRPHPRRRLRDPPARARACAASAETYMGLVEVGVGLVPAGGGTKELALRAHDRCAGVEGADPFPFLKRAFEHDRLRQGVDLGRRGAAAVPDARPTRSRPTPTA